MEGGVYLTIHLISAYKKSMTIIPVTIAVDFFFHFSLKFYIRCTHFCGWYFTLQEPQDCTIWHAIFENFQGEHAPRPPSISRLRRSIGSASIF